MAWIDALPSLVMLLPLLLLGGARPAGVVVGCVAVSALVLRVAFRGRGSPSQAARAGAAGLWALALAACLQCLPLPTGLLAMLSPHTAQKWAVNDLTYGRTGWHPMTLDPPETLHAATIAFAVALFFEAASRLASESRGRESLARAVGVVVLVFTLIALAHRVSGLKLIYGLYHPTDATETPLPSPLLNPNHAAALAAAGVPLHVGLAAETERAELAALWFGAAGLSGAVAFLSLSRGGIVGVVFGLLGIVAILVRRRRRRGLGLVGLLVGLLGVGGAWMASGAALIREIGSFEASKLALPRAALALWREHRWWGVGRGAFASSFPVHEGTIGGGRRFTHVESWPIEWVVELGLPLALLSVTLLVVAVAKSSDVLRRPSTAGAFVAFIGLVLHDLADFAGSLLAVALVAAALLAVVTGEERSARADGLRGRRRVASIVAVTVLTMLVIAGIVRGGRLDDDLLRAAQVQPGRATMTGLLVQAATRHPGEPSFPLALGIERLDTPAGGPWIHRSLALGPSRGVGHLWLSHWLFAMGRAGQGWVELKVAARLDPALFGPVLRTMVRLRAPADEFVSTGATEAQLTGVVALLEQDGAHESASLLDQAIIAHFHPATGARLRMVRRDIARGDHAGAERIVAELLRVAPTSRDTFLARAAVAGAPANETILEDGLRVHVEDAELLEELLRRKGARLGTSAVAAEASRLRAALVSSGRPLNGADVAMAQVEAARGNCAIATQHYLAAADLAAEQVPWLEQAALEAEKCSHRAVAAAIYRRLKELSPNEVRFDISLRRVTTTP